MDTMNPEQMHAAVQRLIMQGMDPRTATQMVMQQVQQQAPPQQPPMMPGMPQEMPTAPPVSPEASARAAQGGMDITGVQPMLQGGYDAAQQLMQGNVAQGLAQAATAAAPMPPHLRRALLGGRNSWSGKMGTARNMGRQSEAVDADDSMLYDVNRQAYREGWQNQPRPPQPLTDDEKRTMIRGRVTDRIMRNIERREKMPDPLADRIPARVRSRERRNKAKRDWNRSFEEQIRAAETEDLPPMLGPRRRR